MKLETEFFDMVNVGYFMIKEFKIKVYLSSNNGFMMLI